MTAIRISDHPIEPLFLKRWSPRAFDASHMPETDLLSMLEAARWAPSAYNIQPWRFLYSFRDDAHWQTYLSLLDSFNNTWAKSASALIVVVSDSKLPQSEKKSHYHRFDAGAAWAQLALQATTQGYYAHAMAGIEFNQTKIKLSIPQQYNVEIIIAIGRTTHSSQLSEALQEREVPSQRLPLTEIAFAGIFPK